MSGFKKNPHFYRHFCCFLFISFEPYINKTGQNQLLKKGGEDPPRSSFTPHESPSSLVGVGGLDIGCVDFGLRAVLLIERYRGVFSVVLCFCPLFFLFLKTWLY